MSVSKSQSITAKILETELKNRDSSIDETARSQRLKSRLSFTEVQLRDLESFSKWTPYESASFEQPLIGTCCGSWFFRFRYASLCFFRAKVPFTPISIGRVLFFVLFVLIAAGLGYYTWRKLPTSGDLACLFLGLSFAFPTRNSIWLLITGTPYERVLFWHKLVALISVGLGIYHGSFVKSKYLTKQTSLTGLILIGLMGAIVMLSFWPIRKKCFEVFYRLHWVLLIAIIPFAMIHGAAVAMIGAVIWLIDVVIRIYIVRKNSDRAKVAEITQIPPGLVKICFENNNFKYKAGQYVFLCVPSLSIWEWHPFSLSSCPNEKAVSLHARVLGDWTKRLYELSKCPNLDEKIWIDGPYGNCLVNIDNSEYKMFILVSGGIGITPMQSICNQLIYEHLRGRELIKIFFIWSVKDRFLYDEVSSNPDAFYVKKLPTSRLPFSFQPDVLLKHEHEHVMESFFHLTNTRKKEDFDNGNIKPTHQKLLRFGRPNLPSYFEDMQKINQNNNNQHKVAVLCCGPEAMMDECRNLSKKHSFDFHEETFNF